MEITYVTKQLIKDESKKHVPLMAIGTVENQKFYVTIYPVLKMDNDSVSVGMYPILKYICPKGKGTEVLSDKEMFRLHIEKYDIQENKKLDNDHNENYDIIFNNKPRLSVEIDKTYRVFVARDLRKNNTVTYNYDNDSAEVSDTLKNINKIKIGIIKNTISHQVPDDRHRVSVNKINSERSLYLLRDKSISKKFSNIETDIGVRLKAIGVVSIEPSLTLITKVGSSLTMHSIVFNNEYLRDSLLDISSTSSIVGFEFKITESFPVGDKRIYVMRIVYHKHVFLTMIVSKWKKNDEFDYVEIFMDNDKVGEKRRTASFKMYYYPLENRFYTDRDEDDKYIKFIELIRVKRVGTVGKDIKYIEMTK